ncbi:MAG: DUF2851 family protein [Dehalococcoidia bacterium]
MRAVPPASPIADCPLPTAGLREAELHTLWLEQRFPPGALTTMSGEPVRVLYRGRPGAGVGPDFRDARISIGGATPRMGDIELHVIESDFRRHGHQHDPAYQHIVLHVVFDAAGAIATPLPGGGTAPLLALRPWVERRSAEISAWLERATPWREPCATAIGRLGIAPVWAVLAEGGARRLRIKADALADDVAMSPEQALYRALCGALGLTRNVEPFHVLADRAPIGPLLARVAAHAEGEATSMLRDRLRAAAGFGTDAPALGALPWRLDGLRPNAHPTKRIDGLAALLVRHRRTGLAGALRSAAETGAVLRAIQVPGIGRDRAIEVAVNAVLPFLIATGDGSRALTLAAQLPAAANYGALTTLSATLTDAAAPDSRSRRPLVAANALAQQGALALHRDWCRRGGCGVCPLS